MSKKFLVFITKTSFFPWIDNFTSQPESKANVNIVTNSIQECTADFKDDIINDEFSGIEEIKES